MRVPRNLKLSMPFMHAFRAAHAARDARKHLDIRDDTGERVIAGRRASVRSTVSESVLVEEVSRDVEQLLNTVQMSSTQRLDEFDEVERSILNYGIPDLVHRSIDEDGVADIVEEITLALKRYEPRVVASTLGVRRDTTLDPAELKVRFLLVAELVLDERQIPVEFLADIATDSGKITVMQT